jgi:hypothetical protein
LLIATTALGSRRLRKSAPVFSAPVPPRAWVVTTRPSASSGEPSPNSSFCTALS